ncbi:MAG TPA: hypothetical protein VGU43_05380 [Thermoplasmata archaeon]|nr:hypothetical protein [Thermoplasmata archaeon]
MRRGLFIGGIVLAIVGILALGGGYAIQQTATTTSVPAGSALSLSPTAIGSTPVTITWSGGSAGTIVYLTTASPSCPPANNVTSGSGASGTLKATLSSGTTYSVYACGGSGAISISYTTSGFTILMVIGVVLLILGIVLAVVGRRAKPKVKKEPASSAVPTGEPPAS